MLTGLPGRSRRPASALLAALAAGAVVLAPLPASADEPGQVELSVTGTVDQVAVDGTEPGQPMEVRTFVQVEGVLVDLPDDLEVAGVGGGTVALEIVGDADLSRAELLDEVAVPESGDAAEVVAITPLAASTLATSAASSVLGTHTLTVLPVYWSGTDGASAQSLAGLAAATAQYWSEQSAGAIVVQPQVRDWVQIAAPSASSCDESVLYSRALAAHGVATPSGDDHVLVYFPRRSTCAWAGLGSLSGSRIWVNGEQNADVFAHEFGHNLGLGHAGTLTCPPAGPRVSLSLPATSTCSVDAYGDRADVMGIAMSSATGNLNTALADYLGLASVVRPSAGSTATVELAPVASTTAVRSVALDVAGGTVYVDFRPSAGRDVRMPGWAGVQVHLRTLDPSGATRPPTCST